MKIALCITLMTVLILSIVLNKPVAAEHIQWFDGTLDMKPPSGALLSNNEGYWGRSFSTGMHYSYSREVTDEGQRLVDGRLRPASRHSVQVMDGPIVVTFDLQREYHVSEMTLLVPPGRHDVAVRIRRHDQSPWQEVSVPDMQARRADTGILRIGLGDRSARYLELTLERDGMTQLDQVYLWGEPVQADAQPAHASGHGVWHVFPHITTDLNALNPGGDQRPDHMLEMTIARNETESGMVVLRNPSTAAPLSTQVALGPFRRVGSTTVEPKLKGRLHAVCIMNTRRHGHIFRALLAKDNMPGHHILEQHVANANAIKDFPYLNLSANSRARGGDTVPAHEVSSEVVLWLDVTSDGVAPGIYQAELTQSRGRSLRIRVNVVDVILPTPATWVFDWSAATSMMPFTWADRKEREVEHRESLGVSVWQGFPEPGTLGAFATLPHRQYHIFYGLPRYLVDGGWNGQLSISDLDSNDRQAIAHHIDGLVAQAERLGLGYNQWYVELWDEPGLRDNFAVFAELARIIRQINPNVRIFANPCPWTDGEGFWSADRFEAALTDGDWYNQLVDVSVPIRGVYDRGRYDVVRQEVLLQQRDVNAQYIHPAPGRGFGFQAFLRELNGWGFFAYYGPSGNPWDDFDTGSFDHVVIYPGPRGPVATIESEMLREAWDDYRMLWLLQQRGRTDLIDELHAAYNNQTPLHRLREKMLDALR